MNKIQKIVLVDDDEDDRNFFIEALQEIDDQIVCQCYSNADDALNKLKFVDSDLPGYIFLDLNMPRMGGKECLVELRGIKQLEDVPVIIYSTSRIGDEMKETKQLGASYYLTKPNRFDDLKKALSFIISPNKELKNSALKEIVRVF